MFPASPRLIAAAACLCLAPLGTAALADHADTAAKPKAPASQEQPAEPAPPAAPAPAPAPADVDVEADQDKRICKSVRADPSSRRKTRVCRTMEEWRELNIPT